MVGIRSFPFVMAYFQGQTLSFRECNKWNLLHPEIQHRYQKLQFFNCPVTGFPRPIILGPSNRQFSGV